MISRRRGRAIKVVAGDRRNRSAYFKTDEKMLPLSFFLLKKVDLFFPATVAKYLPQINMSFLSFKVVWLGESGLHSTEESYLLPNQKPRVQIPAQLRFFSLRIYLFTAELVDSIENKPI